MDEVKVQKIQTEKGVRYIVLDKNYRIVEPVLKYLKYLDSLDRSPNTLKTYAGHLKTYCEFLEKKGLSVCSIFSADKGYLEILLDYIGELKSVNQKKIKIFSSRRDVRKNATINAMMMPVEGMYAFLSANNDVPEIKFFNNKRGTLTTYKKFLFETTKKSMVQKNILKLKTLQDESYKFVTREQYNKLFAACSNRRDKLILALMFETGLRIGEVLGLHIEDCKPQDKSIYIKHRENLPNNARVKNHSEGVAFMPDYVVDLMIDYLTEDILNIQNDILFVNLYRGKIGEAMEVNTIEDLLVRLSKKTGLDIHPHMFRHGFGTERRRAGTDIAIIQKLMRHKQLRSTMIYAHVTNDELRKATEEFYSRKQEPLEFTKRFLNEE